MADLTKRPGVRERRTAKMRQTAVRRARRNARPTSSWPLFSWRRGEYVGRSKKAWKCNFCGVIGSHRGGCHYVTQEHHRDPKSVRRGVLGTRARVTRKKAMAG